MKKVLLSIFCCTLTVSSWAGYGEINSVGDITNAVNMPKPQSTTTNSPVVRILSESSEYFIPTPEIKV